MMDFILARLSEKSTYTNLGILATLVGWQVAPQFWDSIAMIGMGIGSALGTVLPARVAAKNISPSPGVTKIPTTIPDRQTGNL